MDLKIEYINVNDLEPYAKNTRKHTDDDVQKIMMSIRKYGMNDPIGIWSDHNVIVEGHGRLEACKKLGIDEVPCIRLDHLTDEERREYGIMHNKTAELSAWDFELLEEELSELDLSEFKVNFGAINSEISNLDIDSFFEESEPTEKEPKRIQCPHCGEWFKP